jgi:protease-4
LNLFTKEEHALDILALLKRLAHDKNIEGVIIRINGFDFGDARAQEWRNALLSLKEAHKHVIVYLDNPTERDYYIATAAHKIFMNKESALSLRRFQSTLIHIADLLKKVGIKAEAIRAGNYKTAPHLFTHSEPTKEEREVYAHILKDFYNNFIDHVSSSRAISPHKVQAILNDVPLTADRLLHYGLVDRILYPDDVIQNIEEYINKKIITINYKNQIIKNNTWENGQYISVIPIDGDIRDGRIYPSIIPGMRAGSGALDIIDEINKATYDPNVVGIIIRINSPGGIAHAGAAIHRALLVAREKKPIVASLADVAASAGYLIASATNYIIAEPHTITGSIGVFSLYFSGAELAKKVGINSTNIHILNNAQPDYFQKLSKAQHKEAQKLVNWSYEHFINAVALGLNVSTEEIKSVAEGRIWLGHEALARKLIHEIGGFSEALDKVRALAGISKSETLLINIQKLGPSPWLSLDAPLSLSAPLEALKAIDFYRLHGVVQARLNYLILED